MSDYRKYASGDAWDAGLVKVFWSDDEGYIAVVPDPRGCSPFGETPEAAAHEIGDAIAAWIAACRAAGDPVPEPTNQGPPSGLNLTAEPRQSLTPLPPLLGAATCSIIPSHALCVHE
jgi:predicted RNase H-like HicB family nuclease